MAASERANLVWVMAEDMGLDLECYGMKGVSTPVLNRMAAEGIRFDNCYCTNPICSPSRSAMMVGAHQNTFGAHDHRSHRDLPLPEPYRPLTALLREAGYTCVLGHELVFGKGRKTDCNFKHEKIGQYDGVEHFGLFDKYDTVDPEDAPFYHHLQLGVTHRGDWWEDTRRNSPKPVRTDDIELPPYIADTEETRLDWAAYLDTVERMDYEMGLVLQNLRANGLDRNTVVVFIADNGRCQIRGKGYLHETGLHIPMIVWGPGIIEPAPPETRVVSTLDIVASILNLAGADLPDYIEGSPVFGNGEFEAREYIYGARDRWDEIEDCSRSICDGRFNYIRNLMPEVPWDAHQAYVDFYRPVVHVMRRLKEQGRLDGPTSLFFSDRKPIEELYDWVRDPHELKNLAQNAEYRARRRDMRDRMRNHQATYPDLGLHDRGARAPDPALAEEPELAPEVRRWLRTEHPERWESVTNEVFVKYQALVEEYRRAKRT